MKEGHTVRNVLIGSVIVIILLGAIGGGDGASSGSEIEDSDSPGVEEDSSPESEDDSSPEDDERSSLEADEPPEEIPDDGDDVGGSANEDPLTPEFFEAALENFFDGEVVSYEESEDLGELEVISLSYGDTGALATEMGQVAGAYTAYVANPDNPPEDPPDRLEVTVLRPGDEFEVGDYYVETEWAEQYESGEITSEEFTQRVLDTIEVND